MKTWFSPSLGRRVLLAILLAFGLVACALISSDYLQVKSEFKPGHESALTRFVGELGTVLAGVDNTHDMQVLMRALQLQTNRARHDAGFAPMLMELRDAQGQRVFASPDIGPTPLPLPGPAQSTATLMGQAYRVAQTHIPRWTLVIAEPALSDTKALQILAKDLAPSLLIALPFVVLPILLAVLRGLRPLRKLSDTLATRDADELSPLQVDMHYAELKPIAQAFNALIDRLRDKVQRERAFVQEAAHELRTPMAVIAAQAHVLSRAASQAERDQAEGALDHAIARASHLSKQLLSLASMEEGSANDLQPVDVAHVLQALLAQATPQARERGIELSLDAPDSLVLLTDLSALQSAVWNLVDNALRYTRTNSHQGHHICVTLRADARQYVITVADDGPGIPEGERAHIFDRFVRGTHQDAPGTGLGLAIVKQAASRLHGRVDMAPGLKGQGVAMVITAPVPQTA
jgi:two-component system sensor histidine kinase QseC